MDQYFKESGYSHKEVIDKIRLLYGERAKIVTRKKVLLSRFLGLFPREGVEYSGYVLEDSPLPRREQDEMNKKAILNMAGGSGTVKKAAKKGEGASLDDVLREIQDLRQKVDGSSSREQPLLPGLEKIRRLLEDNDFSDAYIKNILDRLKRDFSMEDLEEYSLVEEAVFQWIGESIGEWDRPSSHKPRVFVLVGPTGVGKTTTIAKLAAIHHRVSSREESVQSISLVTIDNYRIGAHTQLETYGEIMELPVFSAESHDDLKNIIKQNGDMDLILVDTIGKSPRDFMRLAEMRSIVDACGKGAEIHLAISATTKEKDMAEILEQFEPFRYVSVILTKLDETTRVGGLISILAEKKKPLSFITDGQGVPRDISRAVRQKLLLQLRGFQEEPERMIHILKTKNTRMWN